jgi:hypothetical protein
VIKADGRILLVPLSGGDPYPDTVPGYEGEPTEMYIRLDQTGQSRSECAVYLAQPSYAGDGTRPLAPENAQLTRPCSARSPREPHVRDGLFFAPGTQDPHPGQTRAGYSEPMPLTSGATFAGFTIVRLLGSGGMGEVYLTRWPVSASACVAGNRGVRSPG